MTHKILQGLSEALYHAKRDTTDPRALVDESNRHRPARELLQGHTIQDSLADALTAALALADEAEARGYTRGLRDAANFVGNNSSSFPDNVAWCVEDLANAILALTSAEAE